MPTLKPIASKGGRESLGWHRSHSSLLGPEIGFTSLNMLPPTTKSVFFSLRKIEECCQVGNQPYELQASLTFPQEVPGTSQKPRGCTAAELREVEQVEVLNSHSSSQPVSVPQCRVSYLQPSTASLCSALLPVTDSSACLWLPRSKIGASLTPLSLLQGKALC